jgi:ubiquinone/menaquinone biosynthesis methyltransferase
MSAFELRSRDHLDAPDRKRRFNERLFTEVAPRYDRITRMLSFGRDQAWKNAMIRALPDLHAARCVDVACGTGDLTRRLRARYPDAEVIGVDLTEAMIALAHRDPAEGVLFEQGDMGRLRFEDGSVDVLTGGYALRNAPDLDAALAEWRRVLRPGGVLALLDFSKPANRGGAALSLALLKFWGGLWGWALHRNPDVYGYIADSLARYPDRAALRTLLKKHGFTPESARLCFAGFAEWIVARNTELK